jgi:hypothetical protein
VKNAFPECAPELHVFDDSIDSFLALDSMTHGAVHLLQHIQTSEGAALLDPKAACHVHGRVLLGIRVIVI